MTQSDVSSSSSSFSLGTWDAWKSESAYTRMSYTNGDKCYGGPIRKTEVVLECGETSEIRQVTEVDTCAYEVVFACPAVCAASPWHSNGAGVLRWYPPAVLPTLPEDRTVAVASWNDIIATPTSTVHQTANGREHEYVYIYKALPIMINDDGNP